MIAWLALVLALLNTLAWVGCFIVARRLYGQLAPTLAMFGLGGNVAEPAGTGTAAAASSPAGTSSPPTPCNAPAGFACPTPADCAAEGCQF